MAEPKPIGRITHFFDRIGVAVIALDKAGLKKGDKIKIAGHGTEFEQVVTSMQIEHKDVEAVKKGQDFGIKLDNPAKVGDLVFLV
jgi:translation initiation factor IF-2